MMLTGAKASFCAAHRLPQHNSLHGHSYEVWAFTDDEGDVEAYQKRLAHVVSGLDHMVLNDIMANPTMENIARYVAGQMPAKRIRIVRPVEGLACELSL